GAATWSLSLDVPRNALRPHRRVLGDRRQDGHLRGRRPDVVAARAAERPVDAAVLDGRHVARPDARRLRVRVVVARPPARALLTRVSAERRPVPPVDLRVDPRALVSRTGWRRA